MLILLGFFLLLGLKNEHQHYYNHLPSELESKLDMQITKPLINYDSHCKYSYSIRWKIFNRIVNFDIKS